MYKDVTCKLCGKMIGTVHGNEVNRLRTLHYREFHRAEAEELDGAKDLVALAQHKYGALRNKYGVITTRPNLKTKEPEGYTIDVSPHQFEVTIRLMPDEAKLEGLRYPYLEISRCCPKPGRGKRFTVFNYDAPRSDRHRSMRTFATGTSLPEVLREASPIPLSFQLLDKVYEVVNEQLRRTCCGNVGPQDSAHDERS